MIKQKGYIYTNFEVQKFPSQATKKVKAVLFGNCGNGKTSFLNGMCNSNHPTGFHETSMTRDISYEDCAYISDGFLRFYDNPGADSTQQALMHSLIIRESLKIVPLNILIIQVKFDNRLANIVKQMNQKCDIFKKYNQIVVILVSHLDLLLQDPKQQPEKMLSILHKNLVKNKIQNKVILYSNKISDYRELSKILYMIGFQNEPVTIQMDDSEFFQHFNISDISLKTGIEHQKQCIKEIQKAANTYIKYFKQINRKFIEVQLSNNNKKQLIDSLFQRCNQTPAERQQQGLIQKQKQSHSNKGLQKLNLDKIGRFVMNKSMDNDNFISTLKASMKHQLQKIQNQQYIKYSQTLQFQQSFNLFLRISSLIHKKLDQIDKLCQMILKRQTIVSQKEILYDIRDLIKRCPNPKCNTIWMRVEGCQGETTCGGKPVDIDIIDMQRNKFQFVRKGQSIQSYRVQQDNINEQGVSKIYMEREKYRLQSSKKGIYQKPVGCGQILVWNQLPRLQNIQEILKQMYGINNFAQILFDYNRIMINNQQKKRHIEEKLKLQQSKLKISLKDS